MRCRPEYLASALMAALLISTIHFSYRNASLHHELDRMRASAASLASASELTARDAEPRTTDYKKILSSSPLDYQRLTKTVLQRGSPSRHFSVIIETSLTHSSRAAYANAIRRITLPIG
jgi:hypothetical protein